MSGYSADEIEAICNAGLDDLLTDLNDKRNVAIFSARYGLFDGYSYSLEQIGKRHKISRERVRQLLNKCYRRTRYSLNLARKKGIQRPLVVLSDLLLKETQTPDGQWNKARTAEIAASWFGSLSFTAGAHLLFALLPMRKADLDWLKQTIRQFIRDEAQARYEAWRSQKRLEDFLKDVRFPGHSRSYSAAELGQLMQARETRDAAGFYSQKLGRLVGVDSRLELRTLQWLEALPEVAAYQEQPLAIPYEYAGKQRLYYPDVLVHLTTGQVVLIEVKPVRFMAATINIQKWAAMKALCAERGYGLLVLDGRITLLQVMRSARNTAELAEKLNALIAEHGRITFPKYQALMGESLPSVVDFTAAVMRYKIPFQVYPFQLG